MKTGALTIASMRKLLDQFERWNEQIEAALEHGNGTHTLEDVLSMVLANRLLFFSFDNCFTIMEVVEYPQFKVFHGFLAGGDLHALKEAQVHMADVGKRFGCKYLSIAGRRGWTRALADQGWKHISTVMYVPIEGEGAHEWWREGRQGDDESRVA